MDKGDSVIMLVCVDSLESIVTKGLEYIVTAMFVLVCICIVTGIVWVYVSEIRKIINATKEILEMRRGKNND